MSKRFSLAVGALMAGSIIVAIPAQASKYSVVYSFKGGADGANPFSGLIEVGGTLYGVTYFGGASGKGTAFGVTPAGSETMLYSFQGGDDGMNPWGGLTDVNGTLYGTTNSGGVDNLGTVFKMTTAGVKATLYSFTGGLDGTYPVNIGGLTKFGANLYGTTSGGGLGASCGSPGCGTVFKMSLSGNEKVLFRFGNYADDAVFPLGEFLKFDGELYGTSFNNNNADAPLGAIFKINKQGKESVLHLFGTGTDGADPVGGLINVDGTFYGTTESGGANEYGTVFSITPAGVEKVLYSFKGGETDGAGPQTSLIEVDGVLYGTTGNGGSEGVQSTGTVFKITLDGQETIIHKFGPVEGPDASVPLGNLIKVGGRLYGTTYGGGANGKGTVFEIKP